MRGSADIKKGIPLKSAPVVQNPLEQLMQAPSAKPRLGLTVPPPTPDAAISKQIEANKRTGTPVADSGKLSTVHTLKHDLQHVVTADKLSLVHAAALEQDKTRTKDTAITVSTPAVRLRMKRTLGTLLAAFLFFFLGMAALFGVYVVTQQRTAPATRISGPSLVFAEQEVALPLDNTPSTVLRTTLAQARTAQTGSLGSITRVVPLRDTLAADGSVSVRPATLHEFMSALGIEPPPDLLRALDDQFFFGFHTIDETVPIIVIPVLAYDRAFSGMLAWEARLNEDLSPFFTPVSRTIIDENGIPSVREFGDYVLRNYDVRAIKDNQGTIQLYYSFPSAHLLVIAESPYTFTEILSRLQASRQL